MNIDVHIVNAFIDTTDGGNPAGLVLDADTLSQTQKLEIARQVGLSETAFVSASTQADIKLEFFTPTRQIAHCGHATIATFSFLAQQQLIKPGWSSKETIDGTRKILIEDERVYMEQLAPRYQDIDADIETVLHSLDLSPKQLLLPPKLVYTGNTFLVAGVNNSEILAQLHPNMDAISAISEKHDLIGYYIFTTETQQPQRDASARMFAPRYGIEEEAATGMAAGPLACYLHDQLHINKQTFDIEQGYFMAPPSPSHIHVTLTSHNNAISSLIAGGRAQLSHTMTVNI